MYLKGKIYDVTKYITQIVLPALGTLYFALAGIWELPAAEAVVGTIVALDTFLGVVLGISSSQYDKSPEKFDGSIDISHNEDLTKSFMLNLHSDPNDLEEKDEVTFKVNPADKQ